MALTQDDKDAIVKAVLERQTSSHTTPGSFGHYIQSKLLTVAKFLGLK